MEVLTLPNWKTSARSAPSACVLLRNSKLVRPADWLVQLADGLGSEGTCAPYWNVFAYNADGRCVEVERPTRRL